jgi:hypothetical protein
MRSFSIAPVRVRSKSGLTVRNTWLYVRPPFSKRSIFRSSMRSNE